MSHIALKLSHLTIEISDKKCELCIYKIEFMKNKILFILCLLVGLLFINGGLNKIFNYLPPPENLPEAQMNMFTAIMQIGWLMPLIALAELIGGILFIIPRFRALG